MEKILCFLPECTAKNFKKKMAETNILFDIEKSQNIVKCNWLHGFNMCAFFTPLAKQHANIRPYLKSIVSAIPVAPPN